MSQRAFMEIEMARMLVQNHEGRFRFLGCSSCLSWEFRRPFSSQQASSLSKLDSVVVDMISLSGDFKIQGMNGTK